MAANIDHNLATQPSGDTRLWRYMDFAKFTNFLVTEKLYFSRSDRFDDPWEGAWSYANIEKFPKVAGYASKHSGERYGVIGTFLLDDQRSVREKTFINCWHSSEHESDAMWKLYGLYDQCIAIQTTFDRLIESLPSDVIAGSVEYLDYAKDWMPVGNHLYPFFKKRKSFEHEKEFRLLIYREQGDNDNDFGHSISTDINNLIENIYISPSSPDWYFETIKKLLEQCNFKKPIFKSGLNTKPNYL